MYHDGFLQKGVDADLLPNCPYLACTPWTFVQGGGAFLRFQGRVQALRLKNREQGREGPLCPRLGVCASVCARARVRGAAELRGDAEGGFVRSSPACVFSTPSSG